MYKYKAIWIQVICIWLTRLQWKKMKSKIKTTKWNNMYLYGLASKKIGVSPRLVSHAEYVVVGSDDDGSYFP